MNFKKGRTHRGFSLIKFRDFYGEECHIQKSSLADEDTIWFGITDANPKILASRTKQGGIEWIPYEGIPKDVLLHTTMHLSRNQIRELIPILQKFVDTGEI